VERYAVTAKNAKQNQMTFDFSGCHVAANKGETSQDDAGMRRVKGT
jgi:hypothetical protein